jgi:hypothetical protein
MYRWADANGRSILSDDGLSIPAEAGNRHYEAVLAWVAQGNHIEPHAAPDLAVTKAYYLKRIDQDAEACRLRFVTGGSGMAMTYQEKLAQARHVDGLGEAAAAALSGSEREAQFPTLAASIGLEAETLWACAQLVLQRYGQFVAVSMAIERTRLTAKLAVNDAKSVDAVKAAYPGAVWPTP